jgi:acetate kinase
MAPTVARLLEPRSRDRAVAPPHDALLTLNAGSSSIKFGLFDADTLEPLVHGQIESLGEAAAFRACLVAAGRDERHRWEAADSPADHAQALHWLLEWIGQRITGRRIAAVGHRVVHGGLRHARPVLLDDEVVDGLARLVPLAPLHQPHNLAGIAAARAAFGTVPQVACFDTAFHRSHGFVEDSFALPRALYDEGVRRYGFHGLSYESIAHTLRRQHPREADGRVVVAHLGNGASMCALRDGRSVASTMGFTALDGLPMGTRCGQLDPGVLLYLIERKGLDAAALTDLLYHHSGLLGLSGGLSNDMRTLEAADSPLAAEAIDYFVGRIRRELGALAAVLGGIDALVFTGGIGENSARVRGRVLQDMRWLGIVADEAANEAGSVLLSTAHSAVCVLRLATDEEGTIARHTSQLTRMLEVRS